MEHPIKMDDLGVPLFSETSKYVSCILGVITRFPQKKLGDNPYKTG